MKREKWYWCLHLLICLFGFSSFFLFKCSLRGGCAYVCYCGLVKGDVCRVILTGELKGLITDCC